MNPPVRPVLDRGDELSIRFRHLSLRPNSGIVEGAADRYIIVTSRVPYPIGAEVALRWERGNGSGVVDECRGGSGQYMIGIQIEQVEPRAQRNGGLPPRAPRK